jgi:hypothetical protein
MAIPPVVYALAKKRALFVSELDHAAGRHDYCREVIAAIDIVLPLWEVGKTPPVYHRRFIPKPALVPKLVRRIVIALRDAEGSLTTAQIVDAVSVGRELTKAERRTLTQTVMWRLRDMRMDARARHADIVSGRIRWELAD